MVITGIVRLGRDAEARTTTGGQELTELNAAYNHGWGNRQGTTWIRLTAWGQSAERLAQLKKGDAVWIVAEPSIRKYTAGDGQERQSFEGRIIDWRYASPRREGSGDGGQRKSQPPREKKRQEELEDIDLPF